MVEVNESVSVAADPDAVWALIGDPAGISEWHPVIASSPVDGDLRHCVTADGAKLEERIIERGHHFFTWELLESPLPMTDYSARLSVAASDGGSTITWTATAEPAGTSAAELETMLSGIFRAGLDAAAQKLD